LWFLRDVRKIRDEMFELLIKLLSKITFNGCEFLNELYGKKKHIHDLSYSVPVWRLFGSIILFVSTIKQEILRDSR